MKDSCEIDDLGLMKIEHFALMDPHRIETRFMFMFLTPNNISSFI